MHSPSGRLAIPFVIISILGFMSGGEHVYGYTSVILMGIGLSGLAIILMFRPQIHWYWYSKYPPRIQDELLAILERRMVYYRQLSPANKVIFQKRLSIYLMAKEIESLGEDNVPGDVKGLIAAAAIQVTFGKSLFLMPSFKKIIVYPSLFRSVENKDLHASETFVDPEYKGHSCLVFAADRMLLGVSEPTKGLNTAVYEMACVLKTEYDDGLEQCASFQDKRLLEKLAIVRQATFLKIQRLLGKKDIDTFALAIEHFFTFPARFQKVLPELYQDICSLLNQDPLNAQNPVKVAVNYDELLEKHAF